VLSVVGGLQSIWKYIEVADGRIVTDGLTQGAWTTLILIIADHELKEAPASR
jgi:hypothetical protein